MQYHVGILGRFAPLLCSLGTESDNSNPPLPPARSQQLLNSRVISTQPIVSFDWSPDREGLGVCSCLDQSLRVFIVTKLNKY